MEHKYNLQKNEKKLIYKSSEAEQKSMREYHIQNNIIKRINKYGLLKHMGHN